MHTAPAVRDSWVRVRTGLYKDDLAKVVDVDSAAQKAIVRVVPRLDLQAMANRVGGCAQLGWLQNALGVAAVSAQEMQNVEEGCAQRGHGLGKHRALMVKHKTCADEDHEQSNEHDNKLCGGCGQIDMHGPIFYVCHAG